ncbi:peptide ABC transporter ATP-binding protein, partial [Streptomyces leeuwenhoekii]
CRFRTRCWKARERCAQEVPPLAVPAGFRDATGPVAHDSACHFAEAKQVVPPEEDRAEPGREESGRGRYG